MGSEMCIRDSKYMAQYTSAMQKLNKDLLGGLNGDDGDDLSDYE